MRQLTREQAKEMDVDFIYDNGNVVFIDFPRIEIKHETKQEKKNRYFREYYHRVVKPKKKLQEGKK